MSTRKLVPGDEAMVEKFLVAHADTSMFLRSNLRASGLVDEGKPYQGTWYATFDDDGIVAVAMHGWNGIVLMQAARDTLELELAEAARGAIAETKEKARAVTGLIGPYAQVVSTRWELGLKDRKAALENKEFLYTLDLGKLVLPHGAARVRPTTVADLDTCTAWRRAYLVEAMSTTEEEAAARCRADVERTHERGDSFVLEDEGGTIVAYSAFNARVPDAVQIGGVWTPKDERGHGYGRAVVAGSLVLARALGVARATLFTGEWNVPAQKAYAAIGFERVGEYGVVTF